MQSIMIDANEPSVFVAGLPVNTVQPIEQPITNLHKLTAYVYG